MLRLQKFVLSAVVERKCSGWHWREINVKWLGVRLLKDFVILWVFISKRTLVWQWHFVVDQVQTLPMAKQNRGQSSQSARTKTSKGKTTWTKISKHRYCMVLCQMSQLYWSDFTFSWCDDTFCKRFDRKLKSNITEFQKKHLH